jgi:lipopolysaccharide assembly outer membrane protein LptD (OstA)
MQGVWEVESLTSDARLDWNPQTGIITATTPILVKYGGAVLTADSATVNQDTGEVIATGKVRIQRDDQIWAGDHIRYNFKTRQMQADQFRTGQSPVFAGAFGLGGDGTNQIYTATNAFVTTDDVAAPFGRVQASRITIVPGEYVEMRHATLYLGGVPAFYFPYYKRRLDVPGNQLSFVPGYRSRHGAFLLGTYTWLINEHLDGAFHADYRTKRGVGAGPDFNAHLGRWGEAALSYYYAYDDSPGEDLAGESISHNRQRLYFAYRAEPFTNLTLRSQVRYQSDADMNRDYFESDYRQNPQPTTFFEVSKFWSNFALDLFAQPRVNDFFDTVERLPEVKLTGWRQQLGASPVYYESESTAGFYRRRFAETNAVPEPHYDAFRGDTYHQVVLPWTLFGWLNVTPRVGGRLTYYGEAHGPGDYTDDRTRGVFNTGAEVSFKASRTWASATNGLLQLDGLRHIIEPSVNYVYVPHPNQRPWELPQFDFELPSLLLLPVEFPDYNAVDSVDAQNVLRLGVRNRLQTRRGGQLENLVDWSVFTDWRLRREDSQTTFSDVYSDFTFRPRSWLSLASETRYDVDAGRLRMAFHTLTLQPGNAWSWSIGHYYLRDYLNAPTAWGEGNDLVSNSVFCRLNENWGLRATHYYDMREGRLQQQLYSLYRDFRSWTGALTFRVREDRDGTDDYTVAFTFSLKAAPRFGVGSDAVRPYGLIGR